jgi:hypothetical protein
MLGNLQLRRSGMEVNRKIPAFLHKITPFDYSRRLFDSVITLFSPQPVSLGQDIGPVQLCSEKTIHVLG